MAVWLLAMPSLKAQIDSLPPEDEEEDFSKYETMEVNTDGKKFKTYCTSKVFDQTPNRLISIGYEFQLAGFALRSALNPNNPEDFTQTRVDLSHGLRLESTVPVISKNDLFLSVGGGYLDQYYALSGFVPADNNFMATTLDNGSIRNLYLTGTMFKPFNEKQFLLVQVQGDYAGDWNFVHWQNPKYIKVSASAVYGWKVSDRKMWGLGVTRTYRAGALNYFPLLLFNYTAPSRKWGVEMLLPARADYRYNISTRNIIRAGFELEGSSYRLSDRQGLFAQAFAANPPQQLELRRSEIKIRAAWDFPVKDFYWASVSIGMRIMYRYGVDDGEFARLLFVEPKPFLVENKVAPSLYISFAANLVSP